LLLAFCALTGYRNGDVLDGRYVVFGSHGQGVFSTVMRARDMGAAKQVRYFSVYN
jgi:hypothetical protein